MWVPRVRRIFVGLCAMAQTYPALSHLFSELRSIAIPLSSTCCSSLGAGVPAEAESEIGPSMCLVRVSIVSVCTVFLSYCHQLLPPSSGPASRFQHFSDRKTPWPRHQTGTETPVLEQCSAYFLTPWGFSFTHPPLPISFIAFLLLLHFQSF